MYSRPDLIILPGNNFVAYGFYGSADRPIEAPVKGESLMMNLKKRPKREATMTLGDWISAYGMLLPTLILFGALCIFPIYYTLQMSFFDYSGMGEMKWIGLYNYERILKDESFWRTVKTTLWFTIIIPLIQIPLSLMISVILNGKIKGRDFFRAFYFLPNITSTAIMGIIFYFMFSTHNGIINGLLGLPIEWLGTPSLARWVIVIFTCWANVGFYVVLFLAGLQKIPADVYESAVLDGASGVQTFFRITIPMLGGYFKTIAMLCILNASKLFDSVKVLTNGGPGGKTEVLSMYIYRYYFEPTGGVAQQGYASAVAMASVVIIVAIAIVFNLATRRLGEE